MTARPGSRSMNQRPAPCLRRPSQNRFHEIQTPAGVSSELGVTEPWVEEVDDHIPLLGLCGLGARGEFAGKEYFEQLGDVVAVQHVGLGFVV